MTALFPASLIVVDTETTGFPEAPWSRVVELAAVQIDVDGNLTRTFETLVRPEIFDHRAAGAVKVHGLTRELVAEAPLAGEAAAAFSAWMASTGAGYVTAFNTAFDMPMLDRMGLDGLYWAGCAMMRSMDIMGPAGALRDADPSHPRFVEGRPWLWPSLKDAAAFFGVLPQEPAHRALADAKTAALVVVEIRRRTVQALAQVAGG